MIFFYSDVFSFLIMMLHVTVVIIQILIIILISTTLNNFKMKTILKQIEINVFVIIICRALRWNLLLHSLDIHVPTLFSRTKLPRLLIFKDLNSNSWILMRSRCYCVLVPGLNIYQKSPENTILRVQRYCEGWSDAGQRKSGISSLKLVLPVVQILRRSTSDKRHKGRVVSN